MSRRSVAALRREIAALRQEVGELGRLARTDPLTGLANRRGWDEQLDRELAQARRSGRPVSVALLDLDDFKGFNDAGGHQAGDRLLVAAAAAWQGQLRDGPSRTSRRRSTSASLGGIDLESRSIILPARAWRAVNQTMGRASHGETRAAVRP